MDSKGFVAVLEKPLDRGRATEIVSDWLERFPRVEQVCPGPQAGTVTVHLQKASSILWENHLQFRVLNGDDFTWVYLTLEERVVETTGLPHEANTLPLDVLIEIPEIEEVVDQRNERRLDELEAAGLL